VKFAFEIETRSSHFKEERDPRVWQKMRGLHLGMKRDFRFGVRLAFEVLS